MTKYILAGKLWVLSWGTVINYWWGLETNNTRSSFYCNIGDREQAIDEQWRATTMTIHKYYTYTYSLFFSVFYSLISSIKAAFVSNKLRQSLVLLNKPLILLNLTKILRVVHKHNVPNLCQTRLTLLQVEVDLL